MKFVHVGFAALVVFIVPVQGFGLVPDPGASEGFAAHDPIQIHGNPGPTAHLPGNEYGIVDGSGTSADPWIIEGWLLASDASGPGLFIADSTDHFLIRNNYVSARAEGSGDVAVGLVNSENVSFLGLSIHGPGGLLRILHSTVNISDLLLGPAGSDECFSSFGSNLVVQDVVVRSACQLPVFFLDGGHVELQGLQMQSTGPGIEARGGVNLRVSGFGAASQEEGASASSAIPTGPFAILDGVVNVSLSNGEVNGWAGGIFARADGPGASIHVTNVSFVGGYEHSVAIDARGFFLEAQNVEISRFGTGYYLAGGNAFLENQRFLDLRLAVAAVRSANPKDPLQIVKVTDCVFENVDTLADADSGTSILLQECTATGGAIRGTVEVIGDEVRLSSSPFLIGAVALIIVAIGGRRWAP